MSGSKTTGHAIATRSLAVSRIIAHAQQLYDQHAEKVRFLVVGVWNTFFGVLAYNALLLMFGHENYLLLFWAVWVVAVVHSTATMKYFAFRSGGHFWRQTGRAYLIYLPAQGLSTLLLWVGVTVLHLSPPLAQLITICFTTIFSYLGHKYFTFRVPLEVGEVPEEELVVGDESRDADRR